MKVIKNFLHNGIITDWFLFCSTAMRISPPLTISDEELDVALTKIIYVLNEVYD
jgi:4-aminobutyrate aminotransferase-like enzyme